MCKENDLVRRAGDVEVRPQREVDPVDQPDLTNWAKSLIVSKYFLPISYHIEKASRILGHPFLKQTRESMPPFFAGIFGLGALTEDFHPSV